MFIGRSVARGLGRLPLGVKRHLCVAFELAKLVDIFNYSCLALCSSSSSSSSSSSGKNHLWTGGYLRNERFAYLRVFGFVRLFVRIVSWFSVRLTARGGFLPFGELIGS